MIPWMPAVDRLWSAAARPGVAGGYPGVQGSQVHPQSRAPLSTGEPRPKPGLHTRAQSRTGADSLRTPSATRQPLLLPHRGQTISGDMCSQILRIG